MTNAKLFLLTVGLISVAVISRWLPHPPNFSPVMGVALFAGARIGRRWLAVAFPLIIMLVSDLMLGWHATIPFVYGSLIVMTLMGMNLKDDNWSRIGGLSFLAAIFFFAVTNFGVWWTQDLYAHDLSGLTTCFVMGLPFFPATLASSWIYSFALFGLWELGRARLTEPVA